MERLFYVADEIVEKIFKELLEQKLITLPEIKRPDEVRKTENPNSCIALSIA